MKRTLLWKLGGEKTRQIDISRPCEEPKMKFLLFTAEEIQCVIRKFPNGKSPGLDGIRYEDVKREYEKHIEYITSCVNSCLINKMVPSGWKHDIIQRIPKENSQQDDLTTLRDICLSSVIYKIFSRCIIHRIITLIESKITFWK